MWNGSNLFPDYVSVARNGFQKLNLDVLCLLICQEKIWVRIWKGIKTSFQEKWQYVRICKSYHHTYYTMLLNHIIPSGIFYKLLLLTHLNVSNPGKKFYEAHNLTFLEKCKTAFINIFHVFSTSWHLGIYVNYTTVFWIYIIQTKYVRVM